MRQCYTASGAVPPPLAGSVRESGTAQDAAKGAYDTAGQRCPARQGNHLNVQTAETSALAQYRRVVDPASRLLEVPLAVMRPGRCPPCRKLQNS